MGVATVNSKVYNIYSNSNEEMNLFVNFNTGSGSIDSALGINLYGPFDTPTVTGGSVLKTATTNQESATLTFKPSPSKYYYL